MIIPSEKLWQKGFHSGISDLVNYIFFYNIYYNISRQLLKILSIFNPVAFETNFTGI